MKTLRRTLLGSVAALSLLSAAACSSAGADNSGGPTPDEDTSETESGDAGSSDAEAGTVEIEDNNGTHTVTVPPQSVVVTDNRSFETLADWGIEPTAAAVALMPSSVSFPNQDEIIDLGSHREPDLESVVVAAPDLIVNGQRFAEFHEDFVRLAPDAVVLELDPREGEPFDQELIRQVTVLGEIFDKQDEAAELVADFEAAVERVVAAYDPEQTVMAVNTSGGNIGYLAPSVGRTLGPVFDFAGLTPALEVEGASDDHQGDDISVEAIASANPDWILVMDRDAAVSADDPAYQPANELLESSEALSGVTATQEGNIIYMPADTYTNEGIQTYTEFLNTFADALEGSS